MLQAGVVGLMTLLAIAQNPGPRIGERVITHVGTVLEADEQALDAERTKNLAEPGRERYTFHVYRVERTRGALLWLVAEKEPDVHGWVKAERVVPLDRAIDYLSGLIRIRPTMLAYNDRGNVWLAQGELDHAIGDFSEVIRLDPRNEVAYNNRGTVWRRKNEYDKAIADYSEAIRLDPEYVAPYYNRGNIRRFRQEYDKAIADYSECIRLDPKLLPAYFNRGVIRRARKEYDRAIADYSECIRLDPKNAHAYYDRGLTWSDKKEYTRALRDFSEAVRVDPEHAAAYNARAWCWATCPDAKLRDGTRAVESATRACALTAWKDPYNLDTLAAAHAEAGDFDAAVKDLENAIGLITDAMQKADFQARLELYRAGKPYREMP